MVVEAAQARSAIVRHDLRGRSAPEVGRLGRNFTLGAVEEGHAPTISQCQPGPAKASRAPPLRPRRPRPRSASRIRAAPRQPSAPIRPATTPAPFAPSPPAPAPGSSPPTPPCRASRRPWQLIEALRLADVPGAAAGAHRRARLGLVHRPVGLAAGAARHPSSRRCRRWGRTRCDWPTGSGCPGWPAPRRATGSGTGGGWYDRALAWAKPSARLGLLLFDDEVLDAVPLDPWDRDVHVLVTERRRVDCAE